jgi:hypothetical protein
MILEPLKKRTLYCGMIQFAQISLLNHPIDIIAVGPVARMKVLAG